MNTLPGGPDTERDFSDDEDVSIPGFDEVARRVRSRLKPNGPEVDQDLLFDYATNSLPDAIRNEVRQKTQTWLNWHEEYWKIQAYMDLADADE